MPAVSLPEKGGSIVPQEAAYLLQSLAVACFFFRRLFVSRSTDPVHETGSSDTQKGMHYTN